MERFPPFAQIRLRTSFPSTRPEAKAFESRESYEKTAQEFMANFELRNEDDLVRYEELAVEKLVTAVWDRIGNHKVSFTTYQGPRRKRPRHLPKGSNATIQPTTPTGSPTLTAAMKRQYDKVCRIAPDRSPSRVILVIEYKDANKLTPEVFEGLHDMDMEEIRQRIKYSKDEAERRKEVMEEVIAVVITQTFDYMVSNGLSYGYVTGGNAFIFLFARLESPQTLYHEQVILKQPSTTSSTNFDQMAISLIRFSESARASSWPRNSTNANSRIHAVTRCGHWGFDRSQSQSKFSSRWR